MTWQTIDSPGKYRACVPYPKPDDVFDRELSGGLVEDHINMTIPKCLEHCISLVSKIKDYKTSYTLCIFYL